MKIPAKLLWPVAGLMALFVVCLSCSKQNDPPKPRPLPTAKSRWSELKLPCADTLKTMLDYAELLYENNRYSAAYLFFDYGRQLAIAHDGIESISYACALYGVGRYKLNSDATAAESDFTTAINIYKSKAETERSGYADCLLGLAALWKSQGLKMDTAEAYIRQAKIVREKVFGKNTVKVAIAYNNLANLLLKKHGSDNEIETIFKQALEITKTASNDSSVDFARTLNGLAAFYHIQGRYDEAKPHYNTALAIFRKQANPDVANMAQIIKNVAEIEHDEGHYKTAEPLYREAINLIKNVPSKANVLLPQFLADFARLLKDMNRPQEAESLARQAIDNSIALGDSSIDLAEYRKILADIYLIEKRYAEAQSLYDRAQKTFEISGNNRPDFVPKILNSKAMLAVAKGNPKLAAELENQAFALTRAMFDSNFSSLTEKAALDHSQFLKNEASNNLSILLDFPDGVANHREEIAKIVFSTKGVVTDAIFSRQQYMTTINALSDSIRFWKNYVAELSVNSTVTDDKINAAETHLKEFESKLAAVSDKFRKENFIQQVDAKTVADHMPAGSALVEYVRYRHQLSLINYEDRYLAILVKSNGTTFTYGLGSAAAIDSAVVDYRRHMANVRALNPADYDKLSQKLYDILWQPLADQVLNLNLVLICPDAALSLISFAGMSTPNGHYLIENYPIHYVSSGRDFARPAVNVEPGIGLLAMGDPDYGELPDNPQQSDSACNSARQILANMVVTSLPATKLEIEEIANRWKQAERGTVLQLFGAEASEGAFKKHSHGMRMIHLATHGFVVVSDCLPGQSEKGFVGDNPLLNSGLFFAGANRKRKDKSGEDGTLTALEVGCMNLTGTELVVLSACETAQGEVRAGEGVIGLRRAFQMAGAKTVISALWSVDDKSTADLMSSIFATTETNLPKAMQQAAISIIESRKAEGKPDHPFYWAAFIATGEWSTTR